MKTPQDNHQKYDKSQRSSTIGAGLAAMTFVAGIFLSAMNYVTQPPVQANLPVVSSGAQRVKAEKLPPFVFHTTKYKFSDADMRW